MKKKTHNQAVHGQVMEAGVMRLSSDNLHLFRFLKRVEWQVTQTALLGGFEPQGLHCQYLNCFQIHSGHNRQVLDKPILDK